LWLLTFNLRHCSSFAWGECYLHAETRMKGATEEEHVTEELITYSFYRWLCRVKHPTLPSVTHDSFSAGAGSEGGYLLMALPDVRPEDLPVKTFLLMISGLNVVHAIESFCEVVRDEQHQSNEWLNFRFRLRTAAEAILSVGELHLKDAIHPLPFKLSRRFREGLTLDSRTLGFSREALALGLSEPLLSREVRDTSRCGDLHRIKRGVTHRSGFYPDGDWCHSKESPSPRYGERDEG